MYVLWPPAQHPKAWRYSCNGGPHGCAMALGRALNRLSAQKLVGETMKDAGRGEICLVPSNVEVRRLPPTKGDKE